MRLQVFIYLALASLTFGEAHAQSSMALLNALEKNDQQLVRDLLSQGADPNSADPEGDNALMYAALYADPDCMKQLLEKGADPNASNKLGETPLMWCVEHVEKVKLLLAKGANINARTKSGNTAFLIATVGNHCFDVLKLLLDHGADALAVNNKNETALNRAAPFADSLTINLLLDKGIPIDSRDASGTTALLSAVLNSNREGVITLLKRGANPDLADDFGDPLSAAVSMDDTSITFILLRTVKNVDVPDKGGHTPLMWAVYNEHDNPQVIEALIARGANIKAKAKDGSTALSAALKKGNTQSVALLRKAGAKK